MKPGEIALNVKYVGEPFPWVRWPTQIEGGFMYRCQCCDADEWDHDSMTLEEFAAWAVKRVDGPGRIRPMNAISDIGTTFCRRCHSGMVYLGSPVYDHDERGILFVEHTRRVRFWRRAWPVTPRTLLVTAGRRCRHGELLTEACGRCGARGRASDFEGWGRPG